MTEDRPVAADDFDVGKLVSGPKLRERGRHAREEWEDRRVDFVGRVDFVEERDVVEDRGVARTPVRVRLVARMPRHSDKKLQNNQNKDFIKR